MGTIFIATTLCLLSLFIFRFIKDKLLRNIFSHSLKLPFFEIIATAASVIVIDVIFIYLHDQLYVSLARNELHTIVKYLQFPEISGSAIGFFTATLMYLWVDFRSKIPSIIDSESLKLKFIAKSDLYLATFTIVIVFSIAIFEVPSMLRMVNFFVSPTGIGIALRDENTSASRLAAEDIQPIQAPGGGYARNDTLRGVFYPISGGITGRISRDINYICALIDARRQLKKHNKEPLQASSCNEIEIIKTIDSYSDIYKAQFKPFFDCFQLAHKKLHNDPQFRTLFGNIPLWHRLNIYENISINSDQPNNDTNTDEQQKNDTKRIAQNELIRALADLGKKKWLNAVKSIKFSEGTPNANACKNAYILSGKIQVQINQFDLYIDKESENICEFDFQTPDRPQSNIEFLSPIPAFCKLQEIGKHLPYGALIDADLSALFGDYQGAQDIMNEWIEYQKSHLPEFSKEQFSNFDDSDKANTIVPYFMIYIAESGRSLANTKVEISSPRARIAARQKLNSTKEIIDMFQPAAHELILRHATEKNGDFCNNHNPWLIRLVLQHYDEINTLTFFRATAALAKRNLDSDVWQLNDLINELNEFDKLEHCFRSMLNTLQQPEYVVEFYSSAIKDTIVTANQARLRHALRGRGDQYSLEWLKDILDELRETQSTSLEKLDTAVRMYAESNRTRQPDLPKTCKEIVDGDDDWNDYLEALTGGHIFQHVCNYTIDHLVEIERLIAKALP